jgi:hypothetical protein
MAAPTTSNNAVLHKLMTIDLRRFIHHLST